MNTEHIKIIFKNPNCT